MKINTVNPSSDENWNLQSALDVLIVLLYAKGSSGEISEPIEGITRLDKVMYLLSKSPEFENIVNRGYQFKADNFGPFAPELFDDIEALKGEGLIEVISKRKTQNKIETSDEESVEEVFDEYTDTQKEDYSIVSWKSYQVECYKLTEIGKKIGSFLYNGLTEKQQLKLTKTKKVFGDMSLRRLLHYVYSKYPKMIEKSIIRDDILY